MTIDVSAFVGPYPFRHVGPSGPEALVREMDRLRIETAWVGHLAAPWHRDPRAANAELLDWLTPFETRLRPVPTVHPGLPRWEDDLHAAANRGAPAVRVYPAQQGLEPAGQQMQALVAAAGARHLAVVLTVRFEDGRQLHPLDVAPPLSGASLRALARSSADARLLVTHADRALVEEVHFGLTPEEAARVLWDVSWIWGPPEDHLALLLDTVGARRFAFGSGMPLRIGDGVRSKLDLLDAPDDRVRQVERDNLLQWLK